MPKQPWEARSRWSRRINKQDYRCCGWMLLISRGNIFIIVVLELRDGLYPRPEQWGCPHGLWLSYRAHNRQPGLFWMVFQTLYRVEEAVKKLKESDDKVIHIACSVEFENLSSNTKTFYKEIKTIPTKYRNNNCRPDLTQKKYFNLSLYLFNCYIISDQ